MAYINQREIGLDSRDWHKALKDAVRQDPDVILIGELRDIETFEAAVHAAETGHLVFGTIHASSAATTINRILDLFPPEKHAAIRQALANNLKAIVAQKLVKGLKRQVAGADQRDHDRQPDHPQADRGGTGQPRSPTRSASATWKAWSISPRTCVSSSSAATWTSRTALELSPNPEQLKMVLKGIKVAASGLI